MQCYNVIVAQGTAHRRIYNQNCRDSSERVFLFHRTPVDWYLNVCVCSETTATEYCMPYGTAIVFPIWLIKNYQYHHVAYIGWVRNVPIIVTE